MTAKLREAAMALDERRKALIALADGMEDEEVQWHAGPERWSILEVLEHLVLAERGMLAGMPDPTTLKERSRSLRNRLSYIAVYVVLRWRIPVPVPAKEMEPSGEWTLVQIRTEWDTNHEWMADFIQSSNPKTLGAPLFSHPVSGPITAGQALCLDGFHMGYHEGQIEEIRKAYASAGHGGKRTGVKRD